MSNHHPTRADMLALFNNAPDDALFDYKVIKAVRDCSKATLDRDRCYGGGIPFIKFNKRTIRYKKSDVLDWLNKHGAQNSKSEQ